MRLRETKRTARKRLKRRCWCCAGPIMPGDAYVESAVPDCGRMWTDVGHQVCEDQMDQYPREDEFPEHWLWESPDAGDEEWQAWHARRRALPKLCRGLAETFARRQLAFSRLLSRMGVTWLFRTYRNLREEGQLW